MTLKNNLIPLPQNKFAIVDEADFEWLNQWKWSYSSSGYAYRHQYGMGRIITIRMHRLIMSTPDKMETDHINGNKLDNRRANLRICTKSKNNMNRKSTVGSSKYKGVCWDKNKCKWLTRIKINGKQIFVGRFANESEAAKAYNEMAKKLFKDFARLNII